MLFRKKVESHDVWKSRMCQWRHKFAWQRTAVASTDGSHTTIWLGWYERRAVEFGHDPGTGFFVSRYENRLSGFAASYIEASRSFGEVW